MDDARFDRVISHLAERGSRRGVLGVLGMALGVVGLTNGDDSDAKSNNNKKKPPKQSVCFDGDTLSVSKKAKKRWLKKGAVDGPCAPASPPPPSPPVSPPPPSANKQYTQPCTPGVDVCASPSICEVPTEEVACRNTVANWRQGWPYLCCGPLDATCTACSCCRGLTCGANGKCQLQQ